MTATASNFSVTMRQLADEFQELTGQPIAVFSGSTGKHYAQILNGAPFDLFFAADRERPERLEREGLAVAGSRFTYALGILVLWSPTSDFVDPAGAVLRRGDVRFLSIANPELAPYGRAALEVIEALDLSASLRGRLVRGENVAQAFQFVHSGNAELGFVALSLLQGDESKPEGSYWHVDRRLYSPIEHKAVRLSDHPAAREFMDYLRSPGAVAKIRAHGYHVPEGSPP